MSLSAICKRIFLLGALLFLGANLSNAQRTEISKVEADLVGGYLYVSGSNFGRRDELALKLGGEPLSILVKTDIQLIASLPASTQPGDTTASTQPATLPPGPAERPAGLVAGAFWDGLVAVGVDPGVARCAADDLVATTSEADLLAMGVASVPRPPEVNALLDAAAKRCGVTQEQLDAAAASSGG